MSTPQDLLSLNFDPQPTSSSSSSGPRKLTSQWASLSSPLSKNLDPSDPFSSPNPSPLPSPSPNQSSAPPMSRRQTQWPTFVAPKSPSQSNTTKQNDIAEAAAEEKSGKGWGDKLFYVFVTMPMGCWYTRNGKRIRTRDEEINGGSEMESKRDWDHRI